VILTFEAKHITAPPPDRGSVIRLALALDDPSWARGFLQHWQPDLCIWAGAALMPNLITQSHEQGVRLILIDVGGSDFPSRRHGWFPDLTRISLDCFSIILAQSAAAARALERLTVSPERIRVATRLRAGSAPPRCDDDDLRAIAGDLGGRPVWLAARACRSEFPAILSAHCAAQRLSHRLLLVLSIENPADIDAAREAVSGTGLRQSDWELGDVIEDSTQVVLSGRDEDLGLWYRVAPLTFMACSLLPELGGTSPLDAAALGSAVIHGPHVDNHREVYARLGAAGAARQVPDADSLGSALVQLIAPDRAAAMALAGWDVATEGAELTDALIAEVRNAVKARRDANARS